MSTILSPNAIVTVQAPTGSFAAKVLSIAGNTIRVRPLRFNRNSVLLVTRAQIVAIK
jgi:hypothetical protein